MEIVDNASNIFTARLRETRSDDGELEFAEFSIDEVSPDDQDLLKSGAIFRWVIGKRENAYGRRENASKLIFRRMPSYSRTDISVADARADRWEQGLIFE